MAGRRSRWVTNRETAYRPELGSLLLLAEWPLAGQPGRPDACRRRTRFHPTEPFPTGITNGRFERGCRQDFKHVEYKAGEFDRQSGAPGLHTCKVPSSGGHRKTIVPPALFEQFNSPNFWRT